MTSAQTVHASTPVCWLILLLLVAGCSHRPSSSEYSSASPVFTSRDGQLHYHVPTGWFDATENPQSQQAVVWIVRKDYAASISVNKVIADATVQREARGSGLLRLGQLTMQLLLNNRSAVVVQSPRIVQMDGRDYCLYEVEEPSTHDVLRVAVFVTSTGAYEVTALATGGEKPAEANNVFAVQQEFVRQLEW